MIKKIVHLADIHIRKSLKRHEEYRIVLNNTVESIKKQNPDRIVIVGDIYHDFIDIEGEAMVIATNFLKELTKICKVIITRGNHDFMKKNHNRFDVVKTITDMINEPDLIYLDKTNFFVDENITYAVWHHPDKQGPWRTIDHERTDNIYIDLFHDPVRNCVTPLGWPMEKSHYIDVNEFQGDLGMFGDIHLQQNVDKEGKKAFSGSLIQQSFDEKLDGHGYLLWDIEEQTYQLIEVENTYCHYTIELNQPDYDNLDINIDEKYAKKNLYLKLKWTDTANNINRINQSIIRNKLMEYSPISIKYDKTVLKKDVDVNVNVNTNINDNSVQQEVFKNYLTDLGYEDDIIKDILDIDLHIYSLIENLQTQSTNYRIDDLEIINFKAYDHTKLEWANLEGIFQITGENQVGKTTILDAICYLLYGKTLSTLKKKKHGDNRFINNKKDLNYCTVKGVIDINEEKYILERTTKRKMHSKENRVTSVTTELYIYPYSEDDTLDVDDALTGERFLDTQKKIENVIGTFDDFIQTVLINADNINSLLSIDRSKFIDSVMRYAGYTIFERKLELFKEYKKEQEKKYDKIVLDINESNDTLKAYTERINNLELNISKLNETLTTIEDEKKQMINDKETSLKKYIPINSSLTDFDLESTTKLITENNYNVELINSKITKYENGILTLPTEEENEKNIELINTLNIEYESLLNKEKEILKIINSHTEKINNYKSELNSLINTKNNDLKEITNQHTQELDSLNNEKDKLELELKYVLNNAKSIKASIANLENSKTCATCNQSLSEDAIKEISTKIDLKKKEIEELKNNHSNLTNKINSLKEKINIKSVVNINDSEPYLKVIEIFNKNEKTFNDNIAIEENSIKTLKNEIKNINFEENKNSKQLVMNKLESYKKREKALIAIENEKLNIQKILVNTVKLESDLELYNNNLDSINYNTNLDNQIKDLEVSINTKTDEILSINNEVESIKMQIKDTEKDYTILEKRIEDYKLQIKRNDLYKLYQKCVHRDGIPTMMLKQSIDIINDYMNNYLEDQNYIAYFDEELNLVMSSHSKLSSYQDVIEGSGKERSFIALALKLALRNINMNSNNLILLDEMTGKLINSSVTEFLDLLDKIKEEIEKVIIIEHNHTINYDYCIDVKINEKGVSSCTLS